MNRRKQRGFLLNPYRFGNGVAFSNVALLLHCDGTNGSTTVTDSSTYGHTVTANGNAALSTGQKKFGTASIAFDGTGDYLSIPDSAAFFMDLGEFTIEFFLRASALGSRAGLVQQTNSAGQNTATSFFIELNTSSKISAFVAYGSSNTTEIESSVLSTNTWYHVALVRLGNTLYLYLDGVSQGSSSIGSNSLNNSSEDIRIGQSPFQSTGLNGYMDEIRIVKGVALYAGNFTPPTAPFPDA